MIPIKLNLGCGSKTISGWVNVDIDNTFEPDLIHDLEVTPWPFEDHCADEVAMYHILEHLGQDSRLFLTIMAELYRICQDGAVIHIDVPDPRHDSFIGDPTHVRPITPWLLGLFDYQNCRFWQETGAANTPLAMYINVDFEIVKTTYVPDERFSEMVQSGEVTLDELMKLSKRELNVFSEYQMKLRVHKPIRKAT